MSLHFFRTVRLQCLKSLSYSIPIIANFLVGCFSVNGPETLSRADELTSEGKYDEAIAAYEEHIQDRLADANRPEWENPYFYLLNIGDIELSRNDPDKALKRYEEAEAKGIALTLVSDRYRAVATWFEGRGELQKALEVLNRYQSKDPLLFDSMLDRIARELTNNEAHDK